MDSEKRKKLLAKIQQGMKEQRGGGRDPNQFRPPNVNPEETAKFRFIVLPGVIEGDKCVGGPATRTMQKVSGVEPSSKDMDEKLYFETSFCVNGGVHWIDRRPYGCPRLFDDGETCPWCELGFELRNQTDLEEERRRISSLYLPRPMFGCNIYFPPSKVNPTELHEKVMWYSMPKTVFDKTEEVLMRSDPGDKEDKEDPLPWGIFYDPKECLIFQLEVTHKGGFNNYDKSKFLTSKYQLSDNDEGIQKILDQRFDIWEKVPRRDVAMLTGMLEKVQGGGSGEKKTQETPKAPKETPASSEDEEDCMSSSSKAAASKEPAKEEKEKKETPPESSVDEVDDPELKKLMGQIKGDM